MSTRASFLIKDGSKLKWVGSVFSDGYPENSDIAKMLSRANSEKSFITLVSDIEDVLTYDEHSDEKGIDDSDDFVVGDVGGLEDYVYVFYNGSVYYGDPDEKVWVNGTEVAKNLKKAPMIAKSIFKELGLSSDEESQIGDVLKENPKVLKKYNMNARLIDFDEVFDFDSLVKAVARGQSSAVKSIRIANVEQYGSKRSKKRSESVDIDKMNINEMNNVVTGILSEDR